MSDSCSSTFAKPHRSGAVAGACQHRRGHVEADDATGATDHLRGDEHVRPGAAAEVEDGPPRLDAAERERVCDAREALDGRVGHVRQLGLRVGEILGPGSAGRKDEVFLGPVETSV
jgi:hypothetical protein